MKTEKKMIWADCLRATAVPVLLAVVEDCMGGVVTVITAGLLGSFADAVFRMDFAAGADQLGRLAICLLFSILLLPCLRMICDFYMLSGALRHERMLMGRFLDKDYRSVARYEAGDVQHRLDWDSCDMRCDFVQTAERAAMIPVTMIVLLYNALPVSPLYTVIVLGVSLLKLTVPLAVRKIEQKYDRENREYSSRVRGMETILTGNAPMVKLCGLSEGMIGRLDRLFGEYYRATLGKSIRCQQIAGGISGFLDAFCTLLILLAGAVLAAHGQITPGAAAAMVGYFGVFNTIIANTGFVLRKIPILRNLAERMLFFYEEREAGGSVPVGAMETLEARGLTFAYEGKPVLNGVNFRLSRREKVAIIGKNGSGKSTLVKLLCGLLKQYDGSLRLNGVEMRDIRLSDWRKGFAYASQDPLLFAGRVEDNIGLGRRSASEEEIAAVMDMVGITHLRGRTISGRQNDLSGGEKQKISIARALLKGADVLILDEPGNHLDSEAIAWLAEFIRSSDMTVLYISHDDALTAAADRCIVLKEMV